MCLCRHSRRRWIVEKRKKKSKTPKKPQRPQPSGPKALIKSCIDKLWPNKLTDQETRVAVGICVGDSSKTISSDLGIAASTLRTHVRNLLVKTDRASRLQMVASVFRYSLKQKR